MTRIVIHSERLLKQLIFISHYLARSQSSYGWLSAVKITMPNKPSQIRRTAESLKWVSWL